jgi:hypothetical protein
MALHLQISWDIKASEPRWSQLNKTLSECLEGYSWVKPLKTTYIVQIPSLEARKEIRERLIAVCRTHTNEINVLISPAMQGGQYSGWLPKDLWPKIQKRAGGVQ